MSSFEKAWNITKRRGREREPSNIMMRILDPDKLQALAQRYHDDILSQIEEGTYERPTLVHPTWPYAWDEEMYTEWVESGKPMGPGRLPDGEWTDEPQIPHVHGPIPTKLDPDDPESTMTVPKVSFGPNYVVQTPNGEWHFVNEEGVGGTMRSDRPRDLDIHFDHVNAEGNNTGFGMMPLTGFQIGVDDIAGLLGTEEKPLEEVIRSFGSRLDSNYMEHLRALQKLGLGLDDIPLPWTNLRTCSRGQEAMDEESTFGKAWDISKRKRPFCPFCNGHLVFAEGREWNNKHCRTCNRWVKPYYKV